MKPFLLMLAFIQCTVMCFSLVFVTDSGHQIDGTVSGKRNDKYIIKTEYGIVLLPIEKVSVIWEDDRTDKAYEYHLCISPLCSPFLCSEKSYLCILRGEMLRW